MKGECVESGGICLMSSSNRRAAFFFSFWLHKLLLLPQLRPRQRHVHGKANASVYPDYDGGGGMMLGKCIHQHQYELIISPTARVGTGSIYGKKCGVPVYGYGDKLYSVMGNFGRDWCSCGGRSRRYKFGCVGGMF